MQGAGLDEYCVVNACGTWTKSKVDLKNWEDWSVPGYYQCMVDGYFHKNIWQYRLFPGRINFLLSCMKHTIQFCADSIYFVTMCKLRSCELTLLLSWSIFLVLIDWMLTTVWTPLWCRKYNLRWYEYSINFVLI
jgi:hypothetical protein